MVSELETGDDETRRSCAEVVILISERNALIPSELSNEDVDPYLFIVATCNDDAPLSSNGLFRFVFGKFYGLTKRQRPVEFIQSYFELFDVEKTKRPTSIERIATKLRPFPVHRSSESMQFSFASKMAASIDPERPVYDDNIATVFNFQDQTRLPFEARLKRLLRFHDHLESTIGELLTQPKIVELNETLRMKIDRWKDLTPNKKIDFILWVTGRIYKREQEAIRKKNKPKKSSKHK